MARARGNGSGRGIAALVSLVLGALILSGCSPGSGSGNSPAPGNGNSPGSRPGSAGTASVQLRDALMERISEAQGTYSVTVAEVTGERRTADIRGDREVEPASIIKLFYAYAILRAVDRGELSLADPLPSGVDIATCLKVMIEVSDNPCAVDLREEIGNEELNQLFSEEGYEGTYIVLDEQGDYSTKRTSTGDLTLFLERLEAGTLLSESSTEVLRGHLRRQMWRNLIPSGLPPGIAVGNKSGLLSTQEDGLVRGDTAIVEGEESTFVLSVIGTGTDSEESEQVIRDLATIAYEQLHNTRVASTAMYPQAQYVTAAGGAALRRSADGPVAERLDEDVPVRVVNSRRQWMQVEVGERSGYIDIDDLELRPAYRWPLQ